MKPDMSNELRGLVREVLRDVMAQRALSGVPASEVVRISNDAELAAFVARLMDPSVQDRVKSGRLRFTLCSNASSQPAPAPVATHATPLTGVITEKTIDRMAKAGVLVLASGAVLTPLARDRARRLGLKLERRA